MPIRKSQRHLYPPPAEWKAIRESILLRAGNACECVGACGVPHHKDRCGVPNRTLVRRQRAIFQNKVMLERWREHNHDGCCLGEACDAVQVVLTIAHLDHDPRRNDPSNLMALCQRCHLRLDKDQHQRNAAATRASNRDAATGQVSLFTNAPTAAGRLEASANGDDK